jgi:hypothetical protein
MPNLVGSVFEAAGSKSKKAKAFLKPNPEPFPNSSLCKLLKKNLAMCPFRAVFVGPGFSGF